MESEITFLLASKQVESLIKSFYPSLLIGSNPEKGQMILQQIEMKIEELLV